MDRRTFMAALAASAAMARTGRAESFPNKPLRLIITFPAGGPADLFGRALAAGMSSVLGQQVVVESRSGAGGLTGLEAVARSTPDGYTLGLAGAAALSTIPFMVQTMPFDWQKDLATLTLVARVPEVLVVNTSLNVATVKELVAYAGAKPGQVSFGSAGIGSITHLAGELFKREAGIDILHVPYRGAAPAVNDLLGGHVQMVIADIPVLSAHIQSGAVRALAVTSAERAQVLPDVPTARETGYPKVLSDNWYGLVAPEGVPPEALGRIHAAALAALRSGDLAEQFARQAAVPSPMSPDAFRAFIQTERDKWGPLVRQTGATLN